jgi:methyl-accepting chemotaxis protein
MRLTIKLKLGLAFAVVILLSAISSGLSIQSLAALNTGLDELLQGPVQRVQMAQELVSDLLLAVRAEKNTILFADDPEKRSGSTAETARQRAALTAQLDRVDGIATPEGKRRLAAIRDAKQLWFADNDKVLALASSNHKDDAAQLSTGHGRQLVADLEKQIRDFGDLQHNLMSEARADAQRSYETARFVSLAAVAASLLIAIGAAVWLSIGISRGLQRAGALTQAVAEGDLTQIIDNPGRDEIGELIGYVNAMVGRLRGVVADAASAADNVSSGSQQLSASAEQLSQGATEQAASGEEASASMEQMSANIKQNADNAAQTEKIARQSSKDAETSGEAVNQAVQAMQTIAGKINIVQEIARQTDLLALNAAVEAARAGEHGRGFAVVASEVRKLAERSQTAATEIGAVSSQTVKAAQQAGEMLVRLVPDIKKTAELVAEISAACREQDVGAEQINQAIQQLDKVTQQNASASEEMSATSEELAAQAEQLQAAIGYFHVGDAAESGAAVRSAGRVTASPRRPAAAVHAPQVTAPPRQPARLPHKANGKTPAAKATGHAAPAASTGFALDLAAGGDAQDSEFTRY